MSPVRPITASLGVWTLLLSVRSQLLTPGVAEHWCVRSLIEPRPVTSARLVSSRSCVRLGSNLRAWTLLDLVCLLCIFTCLSWGVDHWIITSSSSKSHFASYWTTKQTLVNSLFQFDCVGHQTPKSKVNGPRVYFPYNLSLFGDWWQHSQNKQIIKILEFKNYLLARMQCKGQCYMMLKDIICKHL